jgi:hypothetical protein
MDKTDLPGQREELLQRIERDKQDVRAAVHELKRAVGFKLDVRVHIKQFPLTWTIGGFLVGVWLGRRGATRGMAGRRRW